MVHQALLTSKNQEWETPKDFFDHINSMYDFTVDACANKENAKLDKFWHKDIDGLKQSWANERVWLNPPYQTKKKGVPGQIDWVRKAYDEVRSNNCELAVCLLPARTDTKLFHDLVMKSTYVFFVRGRLRFVDAAAGAVFPSMLVAFERWTYRMYPLGTKPMFGTMDVKGRPQ